jgi:CRP/FNR family transcriptional regulator, cyclic AMP receptor protein
MIENLSRSPICRGLSSREVEAIFEIAEQVAAPRGSTLFREGERGDGLFIVTSGEFEVLQRSTDGRTQLLARVGPGGVLGEMSLLGGAGNRSAAAVATSESTLLKLPAARFSRLLEGESVAALKVVRNLAEVLSQRLQLMNQRAIEHADHPARTEELMEFGRILTRWAF